MTSPQPTDAPSSLSTIRSLGGDSSSPNDVPESIRHLQELTNNLNSRDDQLRRERDKLSLVNKIITEANRAEDSKSLLGNILYMITRDLHFEGGFIHVVNKDLTSATMVTYENVSDRAIEDLGTFTIDKCVFKGIFDGSLHRVLEENVPQRHPRWHERYGIRLLVIYPIKSCKGVIGSITLFSKEIAILDSWFDEILSTISNHIGNTLHRLWVEQELDTLCVENSIKATELEAMNDSLQSHEHQLYGDNIILQSVIDSIPSPILWRRFDGEILGCNYAFASFMQMDKADIVHSNVNTLFPDILVKGYLSYDKDVMSRGRVFVKGEIPYKGNLVGATFNKTVFIDVSGQPAGVVVFIYVERK